MCLLAKFCCASQDGVCRASPLAHRPHLPFLDDDAFLLRRPLSLARSTQHVLQLATSPQQSRMSSEGKGKLAPKRRALGRPSPPTPLSWPDFAPTLLRAYRGDTVSLSYEETYRTAYQFCLYGKGRTLYDGVGKLVRDQLAEEARRLEGSFPTAPIVPKTVSSDVWSELLRLERGESDESELRGPTAEDKRFLREVKALHDRHMLGARKLADALKYLVRLSCLPS